LAMNRAHPSANHMHTGPAHDLLANVFFAGRRRRVYTRLAELSGAGPGDRVLDVGCGDGYLTRLVAARVGPDGSVLGVDPSTEAITRARQLTRQRNRTYREGSALAIDAPDDSYDVLVSTLMLHHLDEPDRPRALREMRRVLRPGGSLLLAEFRPPRSVVVRTAIRPLASLAMLRNPLAVLAPLLVQAGFEPPTTGDLRPWIRYLRARKPS
jgi:ubiquinone/menaquinone biosynthesis C-methylase UbiE